MRELIKTSGTIKVEWKHLVEEDINLGGWNTIVWMSLQKFVLKLPM
jgi:hypothetical protein